MAAFARLCCHHTRTCTFGDGTHCLREVGSNIGAELGSMRVTEQIDAMEVSATNPFKYLVVTRITATTLMLPILMLYTGLWACWVLLSMYTPTN